MDQKRSGFNSGLILCLGVALYFLIAPLLLDFFWSNVWKPDRKNEAYTNSWSWIMFRPATAAITKDWIGRSVYDFYCYDICRLKLLMPMEYNK